MLILALLAAAVLPGSSRDVSLHPASRWSWRGFVPQGSFVQILGVMGDIHAGPSKDGRVDIAASLEDGRTIELRVDETKEGVTVCAVPKGSAECAAEPGSGPGGRVDYQVRVPRGVRFLARTVNGGIQAESLASDVQATTVNGPVAISTSGTAEASTVNGSIIAKLLKPFWRKAPRFSAVNGGISVLIPAGANTGIHAETRNGRIVKQLSAFRGAATEQRLEGAVGREADRSNPLVIHTVNGLIELKQRS